MICEDIKKVKRNVKDQIYVPFKRTFFPISKLSQLTISQKVQLAKKLDKKKAAIAKLTKK